jgi:branched-chain amino acid transport system permease protein
MMRAWQSLWTAIALILVAFGAASSSRHLMDLFVLVCLFGTMATAWNFMAGFTGLLSLGHSLFFGLGAYTVAYCQLNFQWPPLVTWPLGMALAFVVAMAIGGTCFRYRLRGHHFAICTLAFSQIAFFLVSASEWLGRSDGLMMPALTPGWNFLQFERKWPYGLIIAAMLVTTLAIGQWLLFSRSGYYWRSIRDNEEAADALGVPVTRYKIFALCLSAIIAALCGAFYASYVSFVDPRSVFGVELSIQLLVFSIIGGLYRLWGPLLGAALLLPAGEILRDSLGSTFQGASIAMYAAILIVLALVLPEGLGSLIGRKRKLISAAPESAVTSDLKVAP